jgi:hypothetical protein
MNSSRVAKHSEVEMPRMLVIFLRHVVKFSGLLKCIGDKLLYFIEGF